MENIEAQYFVSYELAQKYLNVEIIDNVLANLRTTNSSMEKQYTEKEDEKQTASKNEAHKLEHIIS